MKKEKKQLNFVQQEERGHDRPVTDGDISRLRSAQRLMDDVASRIPPFSPEQIHALVEGDKIPQFQLRRRCDRYLLIFCLLLLALAASILWHTASGGVTPFNVAVTILSVADLWVALRAARSLWLMRQTLRLRPYPYRMSHYADRLNRLSCHRRRWIGFVLRSSYNSVSTHVDPSTRSTGACTSRREFFSLRLPSYSIAACIFLLIVLNADKAFAATRDFVKVTTTSEKTDDAICDTINNTIEQL